MAGEGSVWGNLFENICFFFPRLVMLAAQKSHTLTLKTHYEWLKKLETNLSM